METVIAENMETLKGSDAGKYTAGTRAGRIKIGVIGYGYWGPNIVRNFCGNENIEVKLVCDASSHALQRLRKAHPHVNTATDSLDVLNSADTDAVAIITPVSSHFELARKALEQGKHVFVEKPFTATVAQAEELIELAEKKRLKIMVDHTFIFSGAVKKMKEIIDNDMLGNIYYYDSTRVNLGLFQNDVNVIWDLAPHDFSIMDYLIMEKLEAVSACGQAHVNGFEDTAYITAYFSNKIIAHFNTNWLSPVKLRTTLVGGERRMLVWNDLEADEKLKVYDKGITTKNTEGRHKMLVSYRSGDVWMPKVEQTEALKAETEHFVECIVKNETPINDGLAGLRVVKMLTACDESLKQQGGMVKL